jgi:hypothetical protein
MGGVLSSPVSFDVRPKREKQAISADLKDETSIGRRQASRGSTLRNPASKESSVGRRRIFRENPTPSKNLLKTSFKRAAQGVG